MSILPFGCRACAVKPRSVYSKTRMDSRAWVGVSLGRSVRSPGGCIPYLGAQLQPHPCEEGSDAVRPRERSGEKEQYTPRCVDGGSARRGCKVVRRRHGRVGRGARRGRQSRRLISVGELTAECVDSCPTDGGGNAHNVLVDSVYELLLQRCADGYYAAVFASPPCSTFFVSRFFSTPDSPDEGLRPCAIAITSSGCLTFLRNTTASLLKLTNWFAE
eukprot:5561672-Pleurochrysis_carterae.AAC.3